MIQTLPPSSLPEYLPVCAVFGTLRRGPQAVLRGREESLRLQRSLTSRENYDSVVSSACSILYRLLETCGLRQKIGDFVECLANHISGKRQLHDDNLARFLPAGTVVSQDSIVEGFLIVFNTCAQQFASDSYTEYAQLTSSVVCAFFEENFLFFAQQLAGKASLMYRLLFLLETGLCGLDKVSAEGFLRIYKYLVGFFASNSSSLQTHEHTRLSNLANEILKQIVKSKPLNNRLRVHAYETLASFDLLATCDLESYYRFLATLLQTNLAKDYSKYSGKILNLITARIEKEYLKLTRREPHSAMVIGSCLSLVLQIVEIPQVLGEEYEAVEPELAKIFFYLGAPQRIEFEEEILQIGSKLIRKTKRHVAMLEPVVQALLPIFQADRCELQTIYDVCYSYVLSDESFVLLEAKKDTGLTQGLGQRQDTPQPKGQTNSPFRVINGILFQVLEKHQSVSSQSFTMALMLIILQMQVYNSAGLVSVFQDLLDKMLSILIQVQKTVDSFAPAVNEADLEKYVWLSLGLLNALHYYFEEVYEAFISSGFVRELFPQGISRLLAASEGFPQLLSKMFNLSLLRLLGSRTQFNLNDQTLIELFKLVISQLYSELEESSRKDASSEGFLGRKVNRSKKPKASRTNMESIRDVVTESNLHLLFRNIPAHKHMDYYSSGINLFGYMQTIYRELKTANHQLPQLLTELLSAEELDQLDQILSVKVTNVSSFLERGGPESHSFLEKTVIGPTPRRIAKVARRQLEK